MWTFAALILDLRGWQMRLNAQVQIWIYLVITHNMTPLLVRFTYSIV